MKFKKTVMAMVMGCLIALGVLTAPMSASAGGSDSPTPYQVTVEGIYLPSGDVFSANDHVNVRDGVGVQYSIHFEEKFSSPNAQNAPKPFDHTDPRYQYYGGSFLPWEALKNGNIGFNAKSDFCISWVQIHGYNEHFGEGNQDWVGPGCENPNPPKTEHGDWTKIAFTCETQEGDILTRSREVTTTYYYFKGGVKDTQTTTETENYIVTKADVTYPTSDGRDCRTEVIPAVPTLRLASATCTAQESVYTPAVLTVPTVQNGTWKIGDTEVSGKDFTLKRDESVTLVFTVTDGTLFRVGDAPTPGVEALWTAVKDGNSIVFTVTPNAVADIEDCELANSGLNSGIVLGFAGGAAILMVIGALLLRARKTAVED